MTTGSPPPPDPLLNVAHSDNVKIAGNIAASALDEVTNYVVPGIYFYENNIFDYLQKIKPSKRNELEITDLNNLLIKNKKLNCKIFGRGYAWLDAGTFDDLLETSRMISTIEARQNLKIGCLEEIALNNKWINKNQILKNIKNLKDTSYGKYLQELIH